MSNVMSLLYNIWDKRDQLSPLNIFTNSYKLIHSDVSMTS